MEFQEFHKQKKRMCDSLSHVCSLCKIASLEDGVSCFIIAESHPKEAEEIVKKWAKENPIITNADKFNEVFGRNFVQKDKLCTNICGQALPCTDCDWWKMEYKEPERGNSNIEVDKND